MRGVRLRRPFLYNMELGIGSPAEPCDGSCDMTALLALLAPVPLFNAMENTTLTKAKRSRRLLFANHQGLLYRAAPSTAALRSDRTLGQGVGTDIEPDQRARSRGKLA